jgi:hypothetical protein
MRKPTRELPSPTIRTPGGDESISEDVVIKRAVHALRPWPTPGEPRYSADDWLALLRLAQNLQSVDPDYLAIALDEYVVHYATAFDDESDAISEWSKIVLLLRAMFAIPSDLEEIEGKRRGEICPVGFAIQPYPACNVSPLVLSSPLLWGNSPPTLLGARAGYSGGDYRVADEFAYFRKRFGYRRDIGEKIRKLGEQNRR